MKPITVIGNREPRHDELICDVCNVPSLALAQIGNTWLSMFLCLRCLRLAQQTIEASCAKLS